MKVGRYSGLEIDAQRLTGDAGVWGIGSVMGLLGVYVVLHPGA